MAKRSADSFADPYKFRRLVDLPEWSHTQWTSEGSGSTQPYAAYATQAADATQAAPADEDAQMDDAQLPVVQHDPAQLPEEHPEEPPAEMNVEPTEIVVGQEKWSKRWFRRDDNSWFFVWKKRKATAVDQPN